jgi:hypothetical protein
VHNILNTVCARAIPKREAGKSKNAGLTIFSTR